MKFTRRLLASSAITRDKVRNHAGIDLGRIEDLIIEVRDGTVGYAVLSFGGLSGFGDRLFAVPWSALTLSPEEHRFILNVDRQRLRHAPGFARNDWPNFVDPEFRQTIEAYYSTPY